MSANADENVNAKGQSDDVRSSTRPALRIVVAEPAAGTQ
jgi:hypothetical protein